MKYAVVMYTPAGEIETHPICNQGMMDRIANSMAFLKAHKEVPNRSEYYFAASMDNEKGTSLQVSVSFDMWTTEPVMNATMSVYHNDNIIADFSISDINGLELGEFLMKKCPEGCTHAAPFKHEETII